MLHGWERRSRGLIIYSLGNFVFDLDQYDLRYHGLPSTLSMIFEAQLRADGSIVASYVPVKIDERTGFPLIADGQAAIAVRERVARLQPSIAQAIAANPP